MPRAGESLQDLCRACKSVRTHTVIVADPQGNALRVICDHCGSQHNYRGGERPDDRRPIARSLSLGRPGRRASRGGNRRRVPLLDNAVEEVTVMRNHHHGATILA